MIRRGPPLPAGQLITGHQPGTPMRSIRLRLEDDIRFKSLIFLQNRYAGAPAGSQSPSLNIRTNQGRRIRTTT